ncbi:YHS domain-containing (seleno)protein [Roseomonas sp. HF4]|uniref:YHS domain-containing (seleno)protein n=1 Tax=Roseomonas sp. HF4 TaxID=2562313 RepID=UPI0010C0E2F9|nr:YHS domain-containing (seleno)protein [Roseomonas sp. HF4]
MTITIDRRLMLGGLAAASLGGSSLALAQSRTGGTINQMHAGQALKGYDAVAYFTRGTAMMGEEAHSFAWSGGVWRFASTASMEAFRREPTRFAPQFGGFCAWGMANGKLFDVDPLNGWEIQDGKLYVIFNAAVLRMWQADRANLLRRANGNWPQINV